MDIRAERERTGNGRGSNATSFSCIVSFYAISFISSLLFLDQPALLLNAQRAE
jgi:hypothetical protein